MKSAKTGLASRIAPSVMIAGIMAGASMSCSTVVDFDKFKGTSKQAFGSSDYEDLKFTVRGMTSHVGQMFEFRVIDSNNVIQFRGVSVPVGTVNATFNVKFAVPKINAPDRLDFYSDKNASGGYDGIADSDPLHDHAWRVEPLADFPAGTSVAGDGLIDVTYDHNYSFSDLNLTGGGLGIPTDTGVPAQLNLVGLTAYNGKLLQVRIYDSLTQHTVGLFRLSPITQAATSYKLQGIIDAGVDYIVDVYIDANGNNQYDNPAQGAGDLGWRFPVSSDSKGVVFDFNGATGTNSVDVGAP